MIRVLSGYVISGGLRALLLAFHQRTLIELPVFQKAWETARDDLVATALVTPAFKPARNRAERFHENWDSYFRFMTTPGLEPTHNLAEQAT